eukprot:9258494-Prorocentrum_lima.AAC.1
MTSSLVGSEMCIRDSLRAGRPLPPWRCRGLRPRRTRRMPPRWGLRPWTPVSYTHLTLPTICSV